MNRRGFFGRLAAAVVATRYPLHLPGTPPPSDPLRRAYTGDQIAPHTPGTPFVGVALESGTPGDTVRIQIGHATLTKFQASGPIHTGDVVRFTDDGRVASVTTPRR